MEIEDEEDYKINVTEREKTRIDKNKQQDIEKSQQLAESGELLSVKETTFDVQPKRLIISQRPVPPENLDKKED